MSAEAEIMAQVRREIPSDHRTPEIVARYMIRPPITPDLSAVSAQAGRMLGEASSAQIIYRSDIVHPRHQANFRVCSTPWTSSPR
jgi:hypothetical protein